MVTVMPKQGLILDYKMRSDSFCDVALWVIKLAYFQFDGDNVTSSCLLFAPYFIAFYAAFFSLTFWVAPIAE